MTKYAIVATCKCGSDIEGITIPYCFEPDQAERFNRYAKEGYTILAKLPCDFHYERCKCETNPLNKVD